MADLTVSSSIDAFMQAANQAAMLSASLAAQTAWTLVYVGRLISAAGSQQNVLSVDDYTPDGTYILWQYDGGTAVGYNANAGALNQCGMSVGTAYGYCLRGTASGGNIRATDNSGNSNAANYSKSSAPMRLFRRGDGLYSNYEIAELLMYPSNLDTTDRSTIWTYFNTRYGTAIPASP